MSHRNQSIGGNDHSFQGKTRKISGWVKRIIQPGRESNPVANNTTLQLPVTNHRSNSNPNTNTNQQSQHMLKGDKHIGIDLTKSEKRLKERQRKVYDPTDEYNASLYQKNASFHRSAKKSSSKSRIVRSRADSAPESLPASRSLSNYLMPLSPSLSCDSDRVTISSSLMPLFANDSDSDNDSTCRSPRPRSKYSLLSKEQHAESIVSDHEMDLSSMAPLVSVCSSSVKSSTFSDIHSIQSTRPTVFSSRTQETNSSTMAIPPASILDRARQSTLTINTGVNNVSTVASGNTRPPQRLLARRDSGHTLNSILTIKSN